MSRSIDAIEPADCHARARVLAADVEGIRHEMGRPAEGRAAVAVTGASPRECYFQALAVFRKADRLCQEIVGDPIASIPHGPPISAIRPGHVLAVIDAALRELAEVRRALGLPASAAPARDPAATPSDVFGVLATANRQINLLLERPFRPADCYQQVALAVAYAARLTGGEPPPAPMLERGLRPADCYDRLLVCLEATRAAVRHAGQPVIDHAPARGEPAQVLPSDVYDLASLVLGEVAFLHALRPDPNPPYPFEGNAPGRKLPSHVHQLAGVLHAQLVQLTR
ncbi:MAG: hypothetical protein K8W52_18085 [Deltaproteobacteria bacterium]|nr:hypothetical protein [Deltaproteobacteria bacterium]